jgi:hypothetical protein
VLLAYTVSRGPQIRIQWTTESELDIVGFNLYRAESIDGDYQKINQEIIPPASDPMLGGEHSYADTDVTFFKTYYYKLESVDRAGASTQSNPITLRALPLQ